MIVRERVYKGWRLRDVGKWREERIREQVNAKEILLRVTSKKIRNCIIFFSEGLSHILTGAMVLK